MVDHLLVHVQVRDGAALVSRGPSGGWEVVGVRRVLMFYFSPVCDQCLREFDDLRGALPRMPAFRECLQSNFCPQRTF